MYKYILGLILLPLLGKAQYQPNRFIISSLEIGAATYNTKVFEGAVLVGLKDHEEQSTFEVGYVYKRILENNVGHSLTYHGLRGAIEVNLLGAFGAYGTYDIITGKRWLYDDVFGDGLKVHHKIHGEGTLGIFFVPKDGLLKFYAGIEPRHYDPLKIRQDSTPHKSSSINLKVKYTLEL